MGNDGTLGAWVARFLLEHLRSERNLAQNTQHSYRDTLVLLIPFASRTTNRLVEDLQVVDISAELVRLFLKNIEEARGCSITTRNQRLAAIRALAGFVGQRSPEHIQWCGQIRNIPFKKGAKAEVTYLEKHEIDALLSAPDLNTAQGCRDHALLLFLYNTGARADEAAHVTIADLNLAHASRRDHSSTKIRGKGNKLRHCPLWPQTVSELSILIRDRANTEHVFLSPLNEPHLVARRPSI